MNKDLINNSEIKSLIIETERKILNEFNCGLNDIEPLLRLKFALCSAICGVTSNIMYRNRNVGEVQKSIVIREIQKIFFETCPSSTSTTAARVFSDIETYECFDFSKAAFLKFHKRHSVSLEFEVRSSVIFDELMEAFYLESAGYVVENVHGEVRRSAYLIRDLLVGEPGDPEADLVLMIPNPLVESMVSRLAEKFVQKA